MKSIMEEASTISKAIENAWDRAGQPQEFTVKILELPKTSFFGLKTSKSAKVALIFNEALVKTKEHPQKQTRPLPQRQPQDRRDARDSREQGPRQDTDRHSDRGQQLQRRPLQPRDPQRDQQRDQQRDIQRAERPHERRPDRHDRQERPERQERSERRPQQGPRQPYRSENLGGDESHRAEEPRRYEQRSPQERESWTPEMVETAQDWIKETLVLMGKPEIKVIPNVSHNYLKVYLDQPVMEDFKQEETQLKSWGSLAMEAVREKAQKPLRNLRIILESKK